MERPQDFQVRGVQWFQQWHQTGSSIVSQSVVHLYIVLYCEGKLCIGYFTWLTCCPFGLLYPNSKHLGNGDNQCFIPLQVPRHLKNWTWRIDAAWVAVPNWSTSIHVIIFSVMLMFSWFHTGIWRDALCLERWKTMLKHMKFNETPGFLSISTLGMHCFP